MVELTQIDDDQINDFEAAATNEKTETFGESDAESDFDDDDDDFDLEDETLLERIAALKDIVPPATRDVIADSVTSVISATSSGLTGLGRFAWLITSTTLLLGIPFSLTVLSEQQAMEMESEMKLADSTNELLAPGASDAFQPLPGVAKA